MRCPKKIFVFLTCLIALLFSAGFVRAQTDAEKLQNLADQIKQYESEVARLKTQSTTLANQIAQYDAQIRLALLKIDETQQKIVLLGGRIDELGKSLTALSTAFSSRAVETYKMSRLSQSFSWIFSSDLTSAVSSYHYLKKIQDSDGDLLKRLENAQTTYQSEKQSQEELQKKQEENKRNLDIQKSAKANLLTQTKNNEKKYQELLAQAKSEFEAIQAIIAGKGSEESAGHVGQGQKIATIIQGASCNSDGAHLHFIVVQNGATQNPFNFLKGIDYENCSGGSCGSGDGDPFNPSGSWDWPLRPRIDFSQGYGSTWAVRNTWVGKVYQFHNGIDINSTSSSEISAVKAGNLFRGSYTGVNSCRLRYVRVDHDDSDLDTYYLHINY